MKTIRLLLAMAVACASLTGAAFAAAIDYYGTMQDSSGVTVTGTLTSATVVIHRKGRTSVTISGGNVTIVANSNGLATSTINPDAATPTAQLVQMGDGILSVSYDPEVSGEAAIAIKSLAASGVTFTTSYTVPLVAALDSSRITAGISSTGKTSLASSQSFNNAGQTTAQPANVTQITGNAVTTVTNGKMPVTLNANDVTGNVASDLQTIKTQVVTATTGVTFPTIIPSAVQVATTTWQDLLAGGDFGTTGSIGKFLSQFVFDSNGFPTVNLNLSQALPGSLPSTETVGRGLLGGSQAFGKWVISGTPGAANSTLRLYAADGSTLLRTFDLSTPGVRQ